MANPKNDLKNLLIEAQVATEQVLNECLAKQQGKEKRHLIDLILEDGRLDQKRLTDFYQTKYLYQLFNPDTEVSDPDLLDLIKPDLAQKLGCLPLKQDFETVTFAMANPLNLAAQDELRLVTKRRIKVVAVSKDVLLAEIKSRYKLDSKPTPQEEAIATDSSLEELAKMVESESGDMDDSSHTAEMIEVAHQAPVVKLVNTIVIEGLRRRASDIFIEPWEHEVRVRARVDGLLEVIATPHKMYAEAIVSRIKIMSELNIAEHRVPQDSRFKVKFRGREADMRVSILPSAHGEKVCLRILDTSNQAHDISKLGFTEREQKIIRESAERPHGMILVTGPTGSGKTTTLYSILKYLDEPDVNITTVEDPVEYQVYGINQVNVRDKVGLTFPSALRSILRQDPDVVLIGEIRDAETLDIAVKAAMTGHLVLSTLHTNDAVSSIIRMVNLGLEPFLIASTVIMISAQRLVRKLCGRCRYAYELDKEIIKRLNLNPETQKTFWKPKGCPHCRNTGYQGRSVITEIFQMTPAVLKLIMLGASAQELKSLAKGEGMNTLRESAMAKALAGETSLEEVFRVTQEGGD
ncbi:MAG TPA: ATPase, T2SS/T4P/T4SS family [Candidatus Omnitrophota bacterium]|nr:type II secretion system protein GspE [Candidatus Omnitrophota bacterium]HRK62183.1 ATPase, T2SS/T4P/T4SS family [Candidatus Omnitrophota bacterium]